MAEPSTNSPEPQQPPPQPRPIAQKLGDVLKGLGAAGHALGLGNVAGILSDARQRTRDSHRAMAKAAGMGDCLEKGGEDMQITVTGDIHQELQPSVPQPARRILPWVLAAALGAGGIGVGAMAALQYLLPQPPTVQKIENTTTEGFLIELVQPEKK